MANYIYKVYGSVRGLISRHVKLSAAVRSMIKDLKDCQNLGGRAYSDVSILRCDGRNLSDDEMDDINRLYDEMYT